MNPVEIGKNFIEKSRRTKSGATILFIGAVLTASGALAVGECFQNGNYELGLTGIPITVGEGATSLLVAGVAQKIETLKEQKGTSEEPNVAKMDTKT